MLNGSLFIINCVLTSNCKMVFVPVQALLHTITCIISEQSYKEIRYLPTDVCLLNHRCFEFSTSPLRQNKLPSFCRHLSTRKYDTGYLHKGCTDIFFHNIKPYFIYEYHKSQCYFKNNGTKLTSVHPGSSDMIIIHSPATNSKFVLPKFVYDCIFKLNCDKHNVRASDPKGDALYVSYYEFSFISLLASFIDYSFDLDYFYPAVTVDYKISEHPEVLNADIIRLGFDCYVRFSCIDLYRDNFLTSYNENYCRCVPFSNIKNVQLSSILINTTGFVAPCLSCGL